MAPKTPTKDDSQAKSGKHRLPPAEVYGLTSSVVFISAWAAVGNLLAFLLTYFDVDAKLQGALASSLGLKISALFPHRLVLALVVVMMEIHLVHWAAINVNKARMALGVPWPAMYAPAGHDRESEFNCFQRGHQFLLEYRGAFQAVLIISSARFPALAALLGLVYWISRIFFLFGYYTGDPLKKSWGDFGYFALFTLFGLSWQSIFHWFQESLA